MSQHIFTTPQDTRVTLGYDRPLNYVFCTVEDKEGDILYSNLDDENAGCEQDDVNYYRPILDELGIKVPEQMFVEVAKDQLRRVGNRVVVHGAKTDAAA